jgi:dienelactone hydrolase
MRGAQAVGVRWRSIGSLLVVGGLLAGCSTGAGTPEPTASSVTPTSTESAAPEDPQEVLARWLGPGPHDTATAEYRLPDLDLASLAEPVEVSATVVGPTDVSGPVPLVLLLHGYQASCFSSDGKLVTTDWPCPAGLDPFPSAEGFDYLQQRLASHGLLAASIRANGVNVQATNLGEDAGARARSALVRRHLQAWASGEVELGTGWSAADLDRVMLVGHSRGGEGVDRTAARGAPGDPWRLGAEVLLAPTGFDPPAGTEVPLVSIVGYCDGDVGPAPAQQYVDRAAEPGLPRTSILVPGANHNFFNSEWVPGQSQVPGGYDDAYDEGGGIDPTCDPDGPDRLSPAEQQDVAAGLVTLAAAAHLFGDVVAAEALDGRLPVDLGAGTPWVSAAGRGRDTRGLGPGYTLTGAGGTRAEACRGVSETEDPADCGAFVGEGVAVHWPAASRGRPAKDYAQVAWDEPGGAARLTMRQPLDLSGADALELRVAVSAEGAPVTLDVGVVDSAGASAGGGPVTLAALPGGPMLPSRRWGQQVVVPTADLAGVDLAAISEVTLTPRAGSGSAWVIDVSARPSQM